MIQDELKSKFLSHLTDMINDMTSDITVMDVFIEDMELNNDEVEQLQSMNLKVVEDDE